MNSNLWYTSSKLSVTHSDDSFSTLIIQDFKKAPL